MGAFDPQKITTPNGPVVASAHGDDRATGHVFHRLMDVRH
jgi:hypothetical protein